MSGTIKDLMQTVENFGFAELQGLMEAEASEIASRQESSDQSRKSLIEMTMQFRRDTPEEARRLAVPVLKRYQAEMDLLCERSKAAENAYLSIYTKLITLPDMSSMLEYCRSAQLKLCQLADLQIENNELRTTLNDYNRELQHVRHQDVVIKQLKEEVKKYETSQSESIERRVQQVKKQLRQQYQEREHVMQDEQTLLSRQLTEAQLKTAQLSSDLDLSQNQLIELKTKFDEISGARSDELEILTDELARADERAALAEREVNSLKEQLAASHKTAADDAQLTGDEVIGGHRTVDLELAAKEKEISQLIEDVGRLQCRLTSLESQSLSQRTRLEEQLAQRNKIICRLEHVLDRQKDYEEVKKELEIMKSIEFPGVTHHQTSSDRAHSERGSDHEEGTEEDGTGPARESEEDRSGPLHRRVIDRPLEVLLMEKTRRLQHENTTLKNGNAALQDDVLSTTGHLADNGNSLPDEDEAPVPPSAQWCRNVPDRKSDLKAVTSDDNDEDDDDGGDVEPEDLHHQQQQEQSSALSSPGSASESGRPDLPINSRSGGLALSHDDLRTSPMNATSPTSSLVLRSVTPASEDPVYSSVHAPVPLPGLPTSPVVPVSAFSVSSTYRYDENDPLIPKSDPMETRLQEMLRYNMERYGGQCLDTLQLARRVRELLSVNNIGQRMFARYILGLSQGTVSELLSKPKSWDKLTEKGRDSYRKMHAWAVDEAAVFLLKTIIPKKGKESRPGGACRDDDPALSSVGSDERIVHILNEASNAMRGENGAGATNLGRIALSGTEDRDSPLGSDKSPGFDPRELGEPVAGGARGLLAVPGDADLSAQERIAALYQEHLAKLLAGQRAELAPPVSLPMDPYSRMRSPEELRLAMDIYNQELLRHMHQHLKQQQQQQTLSASQTSVNQSVFLTSASDRSLTPTSASAADMSGRVSSVSPSGQIMPGAILSNSTFDGERPPSSSTFGGGAMGGSALTSLAALRAARQTEDDPAIAGQPTSVGGFFMHAAALAAGGAGNSSAIVGEDLTTTSCAASTPGVALTANSTSASGVSPLQRMASITNSLISSASASSASLQQHVPRPMKAVLPPITQQQFDQFSNLNTEEIVKRIKEHLSQFSISQRLFGESVLGLSQGSVSDLLARPKPWHMLTQKGREPFIRMQMFLADENAVHKLVASQYKIAPEKLMRTGCYNGGYPKLPLKLSDVPRSLDSSPLPASGAFGSSAAASCLALSCLTPGSPAPPRSLAAGSLDPLVKFGGPSLRAGHPMGSASMSVYETAAITPELDTQFITTRIKEVLLANNIGQKLFGEVVLGLSQGSVSELLSKPKPWHLLSIKGREPFIRMKMWLEDARNVDKLQRLKCERKESNKRRRCQIDGGSSGGGESCDGSDIYNSMTNSPNAKKARVLFTDEQKEALRLAFTLDPYPNMAAIEFLSHELSLSPRTITNWFHNHRMRLKQQQAGAAGAPASGEMSPTLNVPAGYLGPVGPRIDSQPSASLFDPIQFRVLLNARLMEMQKERGAAGSALAPTSGAAAPGLGALSSLAAAAAAAAAVSGSQLAGFPGSACPPLGFPYFGSVAPGASLLTPVSLALGRGGSQPGGSLESVTGLDLSIKSDVGSDDAADEEDEDVEGPASSSLAGGLGSRPVSCSPVSVADTFDSAAGARGGALATSSDRLHSMSSALALPRSSRRKPAAPQWVNPQWLSGTNSSNHNGQLKPSLDSDAVISSTITPVTVDGVEVGNSPNSSEQSPLKRERLSFSEDDENDDVRHEESVDCLAGSDAEFQSKRSPGDVKSEPTSAED